MDKEVLKKDKEVLKKSYFELIHMRSRCGWFPTLDKWKEYIDQDRVEGSFVEGIMNGGWYLNDIQIKDPDHPGRNLYSFVRTSLPV